MYVISTYVYRMYGRKINRTDKYHIALPALED